VWVLSVRLLEPDGPEYGSDLVRVDPETNAIVARIPVNGFHMAAGPDQMWVRFPDDGVVDSPHERWLWTRIDASTNEPSPPFEFPEVDPGFGLRLVTPEGLWAIGGEGERQVRVTSFDPATLRVMSRSAPLGPSAQGGTVDAATRTAWVTTGDRIVRLDIG
jgi:hypothetical protein